MLLLLDLWVLRPVNRKPFLAWAVAYASFARDVSYTDLFIPTVLDLFSILLRRHIPG